MVIVRIIMINDYVNTEIDQNFMLYKVIWYLRINATAAELALMRQ